MTSSWRKFRDYDEISVSGYHRILLEFFAGTKQPCRRGVIYRPWESINNYYENHCKSNAKGIVGIFYVTDCILQDKTFIKAFPAAGNQKFKQFLWIHNDIPSVAQQARFIAWKQHQ